MDKAIAEFGAIDILVNNAGIQHVAPIDEFPVDKWDAIIAINLVSIVPHDPPALPGDEGAPLGPHHQYRVGACAGRVALQVGLCRGEARRRRV